MGVFAQVLLVVPPALVATLLVTPLVGDALVLLAHVVALPALLLPLLVSLLLLPVLMLLLLSPLVVLSLLRSPFPTLSRLVLFQVLVLLLASTLLAPLVDLVHPVGIAELAGAPFSPPGVLFVLVGGATPGTELLALGLAVSHGPPAARLAVLTLTLAVLASLTLVGLPLVSLSLPSLLALPGPVVLVAGRSLVCCLPPPVSSLRVQRLVVTQRLAPSVRVGPPLAGLFASPVVELP